MASKWEPHEAMIRTLYCDRNLTLEQMREAMRNEFGFSASKSEYERQLKKWKIQKNRKSEHMKFLKVRLAIRERQGKESEVYVRGVLLPKLEIPKKTDRAFVSTTEKHALQRCATPEGVIVITPTSDMYMRCVRTKELPSIFFSRQLDSIGNLNRIRNIPGEMLRVMMPSMCPDTSLVSTHMEQIFHHLCATMPMEHNSNSLCATELVDQNKHVNNLLWRIVGGDYFSATREFLKLAMFLLSNKVFPNDWRGDKHRLVCDELLKWFQMGNNYLLLKDILSNNTPTIEAFAEGIFASALEAEDRAMARIFLESGLNPNLIIVDRSDDERYTSLQFVTRKNNIGLVELLLNFNADINLSGNRAYYLDEPYQTPLQLAASRGRSTKIIELLISRGAALNMPERYGPSALQNAIRADNRDIAVLLLDRGADINVQFGKYGCPLECAVRRNAPDLFDLLLERGANINNSGWREYANTPLQSAVMIEDRVIVGRLLQLGADVNASAAEDGGRTALQWAAENENLELCRALLEAGADINAAPAVYRFMSRRRPMTALTAAVSSGNFALVELFLKHEADINNRRGHFSPLEAAVELKSLEMVRLLVKAGANPYQDDSLIAAIKVGNLDIISTLLDAGADVSKIGSDGPDSGEWALSVAVKMNDVSLVRFLLNAGADPNPIPTKETELPIVQAVQLENRAMIDILLQAGADINRTESWRFKNNGNGLQTAAGRGDLGLVRYLFEAGAELNWPAPRERGETVLQAAVESENAELVQFLINAGADLNSPATGYFGATALQSAIYCRNAGLAQLLLDAGALANDAPSPNYGRTSLQCAALNGDDDLIKLLLDRGADINCPPAAKDGLTALQAAAWGGHYQTVQLLIATGANVNSPACEERGFTALQAAARGGYIGIAETLLAAGARVDAPGSESLGWTALEFAAEHGRIDMLKLLLNAGADITTVHGRAQLEEAMDLATENGHNAAAKFLKYHQIC